MILESVVTTISAAGELNIAPMGPDFDLARDNFELRPFEDSQTFRNLRATGSGVLHVTDNVLLIASSAVNLMLDQWETEPAQAVSGQILTDCCRWYEFRCHEKPATGSRKTFHCDIVGQGRRRDFFGFNRARHAIIEATIAVTRIEFLPAEHVDEKLAQAVDICQRTGGDNELAALDLLQNHVQNIQTRSPGGNCPDIP